MYKIINFFNRVEEKIAIPIFVFVVILIIVLMYLNTEIVHKLYCLGLILFFLMAGWLKNIFEQFDPLKQEADAKNG